MSGVLIPENAVQIIRGTSKTLALSVKDADNACKPVDLTGSRIVMTVKDRLEDSAVVFQKSTTSPSQIVITDAKGGKAEITIDPADTQTRDVKPYFFDVWVILSSGKRYAVVPPSIFEILAGVTLIP